MNREILFRGKREDNNEWVYGYYASFNPQHSHCIYYDCKGHTLVTHVHPEGISQFVGLLDADGNRIFEGDIIKGKRRPAYVVEYRESIAGYLARAVEETTWTPCMNAGTMKYYRIIGNRWDNPELLAPGEQQQEMQGVI